MNSIEEKLWDYIDGTCTVAERKAIDLLLIHDEAYQQKYLELLALNREIAAMELDEPPMAFTYNVMETIRADYARQPLKARINNTVIKAIGGFAVLTIAAILIFTLVNMNWHSIHQVSAPAVNVPNIKNLMTGDVFKGFLFFDTVLVLFLLDRVLRRAKLSKQA